MSDESKHGWGDDDITLVKCHKSEAPLENYISMSMYQGVDDIYFDRADVLELCRMMGIDTIEDTNIDSVTITIKTCGECPHCMRTYADFRCRHGRSKFSLGTDGWESAPPDKCPLRKKASDE